MPRVFGFMVKETRLTMFRRRSTLGLFYVFAVSALTLICVLATPGTALAQINPQKSGEILSDLPGGKVRRTSDAPCTRPRRRFLRKTCSTRNACQGDDLRKRREASRATEGRRKKPSRSWEGFFWRTSLALRTRGSPEISPKKSQVMVI